jgi:DNA-directed RNA polymerase specialized sigma24 family protein
MEATNDTGVSISASAYAVSPPDPELVCTGLVSRAVKQARAGDRQALGFLYARYADNVYGCVRGIVHDHHEAEDITRQVFAELIAAIGSYEERDDVPFFAWILCVARNVTVDQTRRRRLVPGVQPRASPGGLAERECASPGLAEASGPARPRGPGG